MARQKRNPAAHELIKKMMAMYQPETMEDVHDMLKDMFSDMLERNAAFIGKRNIVKVFLGHV